MFLLCHPGLTIWRIVQFPHTASLTLSSVKNHPVTGRVTLIAQVFPSYVVLQYNQEKPSQQEHVLGRGELQQLQLARMEGGG